VYDDAEDAAARRILQIVASTAELDADEVTLDALFYDDLLVDSLQKLEIVVQIERAFGVKLTDIEATGVHRVRDALTVLRGKGALTPVGTRDG
jgi:acyl carrier protein